MGDQCAAGYKHFDCGTAGSKPKYDGGPAFPFPVMHSNSAPAGMSLRDYFAAKAMQGILSCFAEYKGAGDNMQSRAKLAYEVADAMLAERAK